MTELGKIWAVGSDTSKNSRPSCKTNIRDIACPIILVSILQLRHSRMSILLWYATYLAEKNNVRDRWGVPLSGIVELG